MNWHTEETQDVLLNVEHMYLLVCKYIRFCQLRNSKNTYIGKRFKPANYTEFINRYSLHSDKVPYTNFAFNNKNISRTQMTEFLNELNNELRSTDLAKILK